MPAEPALPGDVISVDGSGSGRKALAARLAAAFWRSRAGEAAVAQGYGICDTCNESMPVGAGFLMGPLAADDPFPSMLCESCWDRIDPHPWDGDASRMPDQLAAKWRPVVECLASSTAPRAELPVPAHSTEDDSSLAARATAAALWRTPLMAAERQIGGVPCDCCFETIAVDQGCAARPGTAQPANIDLSAVVARSDPECLARVALDISRVAADVEQWLVDPRVDIDAIDERARTLLADSPSDTRLLLILGVIAFRRDRFAEARDRFAEFACWAPCDAVAHFHLGASHEKLGRNDRALRDYDRARRLDPSHRLSRRAFQQLHESLHPAGENETPEPARVLELLRSRQFADVVRMGASAIPGLTALYGGRPEYSFHPIAAALLSRLGEAAVPALIELARADLAKPTFRLEILDALALIGSPAAARTLLSALRATATNDQWNAHVTAALLRSGDAECRASVLRLLDGSSSVARMHAIASLSTLKGPLGDLSVSVIDEWSVTDALLESARTDSEPSIRVHALNALPLTRSPSAARVAAGRLSFDRDLPVRVAAAAALERMAEAHIPTRLTGHAHSPANRRGDVWDVTAWTEDGGAIARLAAALGDADARVREHSGRALGHLGDLALPALVAASKTLGAEFRDAFGQVSRTTHDAGRRLLRDCDLGRHLHARSAAAHVVVRAEPGLLPGDVSLQPFVPRSGMSLADGRAVAAFDVDDFPAGARLEVITWAAPDSATIAGARLRLTDEVKQLNAALPNAWEAMKFDVDFCRGCGIRMPVEAQTDFMNLSFLQLVQHRPQAIFTAINVTKAYYLDDTTPSFDNVMLARFSVFEWARLKKCEQCREWFCKRCEKQPHDAGGCLACTRERLRKTSLPEIVCEHCFVGRRYAAWTEAVDGVGGAV